MTTIGEEELLSRYASRVDLAVAYILGDEESYWASRCLSKIDLEAARIRLELQRLKPMPASQDPKLPPWATIATINTSEGQLYQVYMIEDTALDFPIGCLWKDRGAAEAFVRVVDERVKGQ